MDDEMAGNQGLPVAHTPGGNFSGAAEAAAIDEARAAKIGATRAQTEAAMADLAAHLADGDEPEQQSLLLDEIDEQQALFKGPVAHVARQLETARAGRGRPKGSKNKANEQFRDTLLRMGFRHPGLNLAALANADPLELAAELSSPYRAKKGPHAGELVETSCTPKEALDLITKANAELMPYFESKAPVKVDVEERQLGFMRIEFGAVGESADDDGTISLTAVADPSGKT